MTTNHQIKLTPERRLYASNMWYKFNKPLSTPPPHIYIFNYLFTYRERWGGGADRKVKKYRSSENRIELFSK